MKVELSAARKVEREAIVGHLRKRADMLIHNIFFYHPIDKISWRNIAGEINRIADAIESDEYWKIDG